MKINRDKYLKDLICRRHNGLIKVITGLRRSGKSYLLFEIYKSYLLEIGVKKECIIEIPLDIRENRKYRDPDVILEYIRACIVSDDQY